MACNSRREFAGAMINHSPSRLMPAISVIVLLTLASCKKDSAPSSGNQFTSLLFDASSPAAREALATPVSFRLTESNYDQWERAQRFLDALPRSALVSASGSQGNAIDRAVQTLEASPRARTAIERTGLTVRDFVLETIALAQAAEVRAGKAPGGVNVPPENVQFVQRYESRILLARTEARAQRDRVDNNGETDTTNSGAQSTDNGMQSTDTAAAVNQEANVPPPVDTVRDTIPR